MEVFKSFHATEENRRTSIFKWLLNIREKNFTFWASRLVPCNETRTPNKFAALSFFETAPLIVLELVPPKSASCTVLAHLNTFFQGGHSTSLIEIVAFVNQSVFSVRSSYVGHVKMLATATYHLFHQESCRQTLIHHFHLLMLNCPCDIPGFLAHTLLSCKINPPCIWHLYT